MKKIFIILEIILIIAIGMFIGYKIANKTSENMNTTIYNNTIIEESVNIPSVEISNKEDKTTPNTLLIYRTYYTKCKHYIQEYKDIDVSLVNISKEELKEKCKGYEIEKFSEEEVELSKEIEGFCNQHYRLKLEDNVIVIYNVDENGIETEYEQTGITTEYLTEEDILKLNAGIYIYGKENLTSAIEDYE